MMGARIRDYDWSTTSLGSLAQWPQSLRTSVSLMLAARHPMWIGWGPEATFLYNDAYVSVLSLAKHPWALGRPAAEVWAEIWDVCGPLADKVFRDGEASFVDDVQLFMNRGGFVEETYYSFSYSPIRDESGNVAGLFCPSAEVSAKVLNARRLATLSELAAKALVEKTVEAACASAFAILAKDSSDVPFALLYELNHDTATARRIALTGVDPDDAIIAPKQVSLSAKAASAVLWPIGSVATAGTATSIPVNNVDGLPLGLARQPIAEALVLPVTLGGDDRPIAVLIAGVNATRKVDAEYRTFFDLIAGQLASAIQNARASEEDRRRVEALAELDRAKTAFFSNVSHEFRTPLTLMLGPLEELRARASDAPALIERSEIDVVHRNSLRLLKLVNTLLDFSRIEAGRAEAAFVETDLARLTADLASVFRSAMAKGELAFAIDCPPLPQQVFVDTDLWEKIVFNLLSNALKFTLSGEVRVALLAEPEHAVLRVCDTGLGIAPAELPNLFKRFHRIENVRGRTHEGTGIGLALVHELVKLHGGTMEVKSEPGRGTEFRVRVPFGKKHLPRERIGFGLAETGSRLRADSFVEEALSWLPEIADRGLRIADSENPSALRRNGAPALPPNPQSEIRNPQSPMPRVLLVEDNADMRDYVRRLLGDLYEVQAVGDGAAALEAARRDPPDLVLSDVMMPAMNGFELVQRLRADERLRTTPIILLSARAGEEARVEGAAQGADDYLTKPFSARELLARVAVHLELARMRRAAAAITRESEARQSFLLKLGDALRFLADPMEIQAAASRVLGEYLGANRVVYFEVRGADYFVGRDYTNGVPSLAGGGYPIASFGERILAIFRSGRLDCSRDVLNDESLPPEERAAYAAIQLGAYVGVPLVKAGEFVAGLGVHMREPRNWAAGEIALVQETAERTWDAVARARVERALRDSDERLRLATEAADIYSWEVDLAAGTLFWSANAHAVLGFPRESLSEKLSDAFALVHPDDRVDTQRVIQAAMAAGENYETEVRLVHPLTRESVWVTSQGVAMQNVASSAARTRYLGISQNITARKRREAHLAFLAEISDDLARLSAADETMQTVGQKIGAFLQISSCAFNEVDVARAESRMRYGWFRSDVPNLVGGVYRHSDFATDEFHQANAAGKMIVLGDTHHDSRIANQASYDAIKMRSFVTVPFIAGGVWKHMLSVMDSKPREWRADEVELIRELCNRIFSRLERANAEAALRGSEARFRAAVSAVSSLIWTTNAGGEMEGEQPGWSGFTGQTRGELQGYGWAQAVHPDDARPTLDAWKQAVSEKRMFEFEHRVRRHDGAWRVCSVRAVPVNETGEVREWVGVHTDITERKRAEGRLRRLFDSNMQGVVFWNLQGAITHSNDAFLRLVGYTRDDLAAGLVSWVAITPPEYVQLDQRSLAEIAATGVCTPVEKELIRKDGTRVPILAGGASFDDNANEGVSFVLDITTLKHAETALLAAHQQQRALSRRLLEVQETERRKIARDLHDELGQVLTAVKINLQTVEPAAGGPLAPSVALVDRALQQTRSLTLALRPPLLDDLGLVPALRWLVDAQARQAGCRITLAAEPLPDRPGAAVETACFRIAQEAVTNAQRHARATLIAVELRLVGDELQLTVRDDGTGFDLVAVRTRALRGGSFGVLGMEERAALAGARMEWDSAAGRGTTVQATFPFSPALADDKDPTA